jgi:small-conductance mechanosensitive channel
MNETPVTQTIREVTEFFFDNPLLLNLVQAAVGILVLYVVYKILLRSIRRVILQKLRAQTLTLVEKIIRYAFIVVAVMYVFKMFGININAVLGAAGIAGVAIGFAAQTSVSNIISGFFLLSEKTIKTGDFIEVENTRGSVDSINLLSIKLKTPENQMVRVPNETIIKSNLINYSMFPLRRYSLRVQVAYETDLEASLAVLSSVPALCGDVIAREPPPAVYVDSFDDSGITLVLNAWFKRENLFAAKSALFTVTKKTFESKGIVIPFPQMDVHVSASQ